MLSWIRSVEEDVDDASDMSVQSDKRQRGDEPWSSRRPIIA